MKKSISYSVISHLFRIWNSIKKKRINGKNDNKKIGVKTKKKTLKFDFIFCNQPTFSNMKFNSTILKIWKMWKYQPILREFFCFWFLFTRGKKVLAFWVHPCDFRHFFSYVKNLQLHWETKKNTKKFFFKSWIWSKKNARLYCKKVPSFYG